MSMPACLRRWIILMAGLMLSVPSHISLSEDMSAELPGRLFTTPGERRLLDQLRISGEDGVNTAQQPEPLPTSAESSGGVTGLVYRAHGGSTVWINNKPIVVDAQAIRYFLQVSEDRAGALRIEPPTDKTSIGLEHVPAFPASE